MKLPKKGFKISILECFGVTLRSDWVWNGSLILFKIILTALSMRILRRFKYFLPPWCTCHRGRGQWCHLALEEGGRGNSPLPRQTSSGKVVSPSVCRARRSPQEINMSSWANVGCRTAAFRVFTNIRDFWWILSRLPVRVRSLRGRIQSSEMRNWILTALLLVHLPTGEAFNAFFKL